MKKVIFVVNSLGKGGGERVVTNLANKISETNEVHIIMIKNECHYEISNKIKCHCINVNGKLSKINLVFQGGRILDRILNEIGYDDSRDIITSHLPLSHVICKLSKFSKSIHYVIHTVYSRKFTNHKHLRKLFLRFLYKNVKIVGVSQGVVNELKYMFHVDSKNWNVIYNPINIESIQSLAKEKIEYYRKFILMVGRLEKSKNFDMAIKEFIDSGLYKRTDLLIIGDGSEKNNLLYLIEKYNMQEHIKLLGWQDNPYKWMKNAEVLLSCSEYESFSMAIIEALACETKVVSYDCDYGPREILTEELSIYLVKDMKQIMKHVELALEMYPNELLKYANKYNIDEICEQYLNLK